MGIVRRRRREIGTRDPYVSQRYDPGGVVARMIQNRDGLSEWRRGTCLKQMINGRPNRRDLVPTDAEKAGEDRGPPFAIADSDAVSGYLRRAREKRG